MNKNLALIVRCTENFEKITDPKLTNVFMVEIFLKRVVTVMTKTSNNLNG